MNLVWPDDYVDKVIQGDCLEVMRGIPDRSVDLVLTDPPYGFGRFEHDSKEFAYGLIEPTFQEYARVLRNGGWAFVFWGTGTLDLLLRQENLKFQRLLTLYKPADCTYPWRGWLLKSEVIAIFSKDKPTPLIDRHPYHDDCYIHCWTARGTRVSGHPAIKPLPIVRDLCRRVDGIILDPFLGSGTTAVACQLENRHFIGIEINPDYCKIAEQRLANLQPEIQFAETKR